MAKRWSKLQKEIYNLIDENINLQLHGSVYRMDSQRGSIDMPRYWITLGKEIIFDYPKQFINDKLLDSEGMTVKNMYPYITDISSISDILRAYIDTPVDDLLTYIFEQDLWGLTDILKASDRRIGKKKLLEHFVETEKESVKKVLQARKFIV